MQTERIESLKTEIVDKKEEIRDKQKEIDSFDVSEYASDDQYREWLDCDGTITVFGLEFYPSRILEALDPTAYRCGFSDYTEGLYKEDFDEYKYLAEQLEELENELDDLEAELEDLESEDDD